MNIKTITQKSVNGIFKEYSEIAFPKNTGWWYYDIWHYYDASLLIDYLKSSVNDGFRLGIQGWQHTKLKIKLLPDGDLLFGIYPNGDKFTKSQKHILGKLEEWAERLNNEL